MKRRVELKIFGLVQGVFYRARTTDKAKELGLTGWVRNEADRTVLLQAQGEEDLLRQLIEWCNEGPSLARVDEVKVVEIDPLKEESDFVIVKS